MIKLPGVPTGTFKAVVDGKIVRWTPKSSLTLIASQSAAEEGLSLDREVHANPSGKAAKTEWRTAPMVSESARLFIGFNVGDRPLWRAGEVYLLTFLLREKQLIEAGGKGNPAFSYYVGIGAFASIGQPVAAEKSAQIVFLNFDQNSNDFFDSMIDLAEDVGAWLSQESVLVELSKQGNAFYSKYIDANKDISKTVQTTKKYLNDNAYRIGKDVYDMGKQASSGSGSDQDEPW